uniref:Sensor histidine kinase n=1 Tax=Strongyloides venezuelensis TaxID=75913 RepID=A0A0K0G5C3_STRVS
MKNRVGDRLHSTPFWIFILVHFVAYGFVHFAYILYRVLYMLNIEYIRTSYRLLYETTVLYNKLNSILMSVYSNLLSLSDNTISALYTPHEDLKIILQASPMKSFTVEGSYLLVLRKPRVQFIHENQSNNSISIIWNNFAFEIYSVAGFIITGSHRIRQLQLRISY